MVTKNIYGYEIPCKWEHDCNTVMKLDNVNFGGQTGLRLIQGDKSIDIVLPKEIAVAIAGACESIIAAEQSVQPTPSGRGGSAGKRVRKSKVGLPA